MSEIGIRELKIRASEILRQVKEDGQRYIVTRHGRPQAAIVPIEEVQSEAVYQSKLSAWDELVAIGVQISKSWKSDKTSTEILSEMRR
jgi:prevent-host-death family protein